MKPEDLMDAIGEIKEEKIEAAHGEARTKQNAWKRWAALAASLLIVVGGVYALTRGGGNTGQESLLSTETPPAQTAPTSQSAQPHSTEPSTPDGPPSPYLLAAAVIPELPKYPVNPTDSKDYKAWWDAYREQVRKKELYSGRLDSFLRNSLPVLLEGEEGENRVCSPLNLYLALAMLAESAGGESREQLMHLLGTEDLETLRSLADAVWSANYREDGLSKSVLSASLWLNEDVEFVQDTLERLAADYHASTFRGETGSPAYDAALREWINDCTGGLLETYVQDIALDRDTILALVTAVDYHAQWIAPFREEDNETALFHTPSGDEEAVFLRQTTEQEYYWGEHFSAAEKTIELGSYIGSMWFILPDEGHSPEELLTESEALDFLLIDKGRYYEDGSDPWPDHAHVKLHLSVPKFDVSAKTDLIGGMKRLGVTDVFEPGLADFSPTVVNHEALLPYIAKAEHAARVSIDEEGVTGAAYTIADMRAGGVPPQPREDVYLTLDRPFLFVITGPDKLPLFVGIVNQP